ncbi:MAG: hypothetical protein HY394_00530 [Candidatus Diapherotrites archaeon]|nr:hypothetical protein [Candidatus Diapherotrites archaeon]
MPVNEAFDPGLVRQLLDSALARMSEQEPQPQKPVDWNMVFANAEAAIAGGDRAKREAALDFFRLVDKYALIAGHETEIRRLRKGAKYLVPGTRIVDVSGSVLRKISLQADLIQRNRFPAAEESRQALEFADRCRTKVLGILVRASPNAKEILARGGRIERALKAGRRPRDALPRATKSMRRPLQ